MIHFLDFYRSDKPVFSLEVFPPKTDKGLESLLQEIEKLRSINPAFISVTYGAMGSTQNTTKDLVQTINNHLQIPTAFHFTCVGSRREEISRYVLDLAGQGVNLVVALRGDNPQNGHGFDGDFKYANELVTYLKSLHPFSVAVAGYPEKHIEAASFAEDIQNLKRKVDSGADIILTQLFFDNEDYYKWLEQIRRAGIDVPVIPGIMPIAKLNQIKKITSMCGAKLPAALLAQLEACQNDDAAMEAVGLEHAVKQCQDLIKNNALGIHFYCLNRADVILKIVERL